MGRRKKQEYKPRIGPDGEPILPGFFDDTLGCEAPLIILSGPDGFTYAGALREARKVKPQITRYCEFEGAYGFDGDGTAQDGRDGPVVVIKATGEVLPFTSYAPQHSGELIQEWGPLRPGGQ